MRPDSNCNRAATRAWGGSGHRPGRCCCPVQCMPDEQDCLPRDDYAGSLLSDTRHRCSHRFRCEWGDEGPRGCGAASGINAVSQRPRGPVAPSARQQLSLRPGAHPERKFECRVLLEVCDPVEDDAYELESLIVDDRASCRLVGGGCSVRRGGPTDHSARTRIHARNLGPQPGGLADRSPRRCRHRLVPPAS